jgi:glutamate-1-semialdehyde 2,1-aminomutase
MTNVGIVLPEAGYLKGIEALAKKYGTKLIIDETHTISAGAGGMTSQLGLKPDFFVIGKAIGGGIPTGTFGMTHEMAAEIAAKVDREVVDTGGVGGTLAGNALSLASMKATLTQVLTPANFEKMIALGNRWSDGVDAAIKEFNLPWHCNRLGARGEYLFSPKAPRTGREAADAGDFELEQYIHLRLLNDGFLLTPFHNMALMSPVTTEADVDAHTAAFREMCAEIASWN